jgi:hypothetical protein
MGYIESIFRDTNALQQTSCMGISRKMKRTYPDP